MLDGRINFFKSVNILKPSSFIILIATNLLQSLENLLISGKKSKLGKGLKNKQGIAETAKTNGPTCDNTCIQKI